MSIVGEVTSNIVKWEMRGDRERVATHLASHDILIKVNAGAMRLVTHRQTGRECIDRLVLRIRESLSE